MTNYKFDKLSNSRRCDWAGLRKVFMPLLMVAGVTGCTMVGPDFKKLDARVAPEWLPQEQDSVVTEYAEHREWWKNFNDPTLDTLIEKAYQQNLTLQVAGLRVYEARAILGYATGTLYPQVQGMNGSAANIHISEKSEPISNLPPFVGSLVDTRYDRYSVGFDAVWELDFWGRFRRGVESADANLAATVASYDDFLVTLTGEVAKAYVLLRTFEERLTYANDNVAIQQRGLEIADVRHRNELVTELDVQLARSLLYSTRATIPVLETGIRQAKLALSLMLSMPPSELSDILGASGTIPTATGAVAIGIPADLLRRRPDVRRNELKAAAQSARIGIATADMYPALRVSGLIGSAADSTGDLFDSGSGFGVAGVGINWKFLNYGRLRNNVRVEDASFQQLVLAYETSVLNAAREVEDGLIRFNQSGKRVSYLEVSVKSARRAVELAQLQYKDGLVNYNDVLDAQQFLSINEDQLTAARGDVASSLIATYKALGGGWQMREGQDFISDELKDVMQQRTNWGGLMDASSVKPVAAEDRGSWRLPDQ